MRILTRSILREVSSSALLGAVLFTFVLFLQRIGRLFEILVRSSAPPFTVLQLFVLAIPFTLAFTIPLGVLVGTLIALSRMSSDGEITGMRASGVPTRKVITPVLILAIFGTLITATATLWLTPWSLWKTDKMVNQVLAAQLTAEVEARVFEEQFPNTILYVEDVIPGPVARWKNVFLADLTPPSERSGDNRDRGDAPKITVASSALAVPDVTHNRIQILLFNGSTHEVGKNALEYYRTGFARSEQLLQAQKPGEVRIAKAITEVDTVPLYRIAYGKQKVDPQQSLEARIEFQQRIALPPACILLALIGIPLGASSRKGGKSTAFVLTVALAFIYWMSLISLIGLARQRTLPVGLAVWLPNAIFAAIALVLLTGLDSPGDRDWVGTIRGWARNLADGFRGRSAAQAASGLPVRVRLRIPVLLQLLDTYVLSSFVFYFVVMLATFVMIFEVFTFFELLSDIIKNHIAMRRVGEYLFFLAPKLIYDSTPISVLVAVLITFGILAKHNEVTAMKACGISLYRLAIPILVASFFLSGGLFAFDHYYVPGANRRQDAIRNEIKGRPVQTYLRADRKWIFGEGPRIYYYKYFDQGRKEMAGVHVYELDPSDFHMRRHISAERAHWEASIHQWVFENGWSIDFDNSHEHFDDFTGRTATFPELKEGADYFLKEELQYKQMNFEQLDAYIHELQQGGFETIALQVQFYRKFAVPLFALIMALISLPFAFVAGNRGAMAGVGVSIGIAIAYWTISALFEQVGNVSLLPAPVAAWSPDALFSLAGLYFFTRMRS